MIRLLILSLMIFLLCIIAPFPAYSNFSYKSYVVQRDRGTDILCDPYIVQKNDWVHKLFKQKGEIAYKNFQEFLSIFKRMNPHIHNINKIHPGQQLFIPLKKLEPGAMPGQSSGIVTIPFITISSIEDIVKASLAEYKIKKGDCISKLVAQGYGLYGTGSYIKGVALFKLTNPNVNNLHNIYPGQIIYMPDPSIQKEQWYRSIFDNSGNIIRKLLSMTPLEISTDRSESLTSEKTQINNSGNKKNEPVSFFQGAANILDAKLLNNGAYYFPKQGEEDFQLDLSRFPIMEFKDKSRIIFSEGNIKKSDLKAIKAFWENVKILPIRRKASREEIFDSIFSSFQKDTSKNQLSFSDKGVKIKVSARWIIDKSSAAGNKSRSSVCMTLINSRNEQTPDLICRYLERHNIIIKDILQDKKGKREKSKKESKKPAKKNHAQDVTGINASNYKAFVNNLLATLGYNYAQSVSISFPYAGIQVEAMSNLVSKSDGKMLLVDFGDLYGDAIFTIKKTGLDVICIKEEYDFPAIIEKLLYALNVSYVKDPMFFAAKRPDNYNTSLTISGFLIANTDLSILSEHSKQLTKKSKTLIATAPLHYDIVQFLTEQDIRLLMVND